MRPEPMESAAVSATPDARLGDRVRVPGQTAAGEPAQPLVEGDVDRVEERADLRGCPRVVGGALPEPRAVQVHRRSRPPHELHLRFQIRPLGQATADLALGQLEEHGGQALRDPLEIRQRDQLPRAADGNSRQTVEALVGALLVQIQMGRGMKPAGPDAPPIRMDPQGDLLGHDPARHEHRRGLAEDTTDLALERFDGAAGPIDVQAEVRGNLGQQLGGRPEAVAEEGTRARGPTPLEALDVLGPGGRSVLHAVGSSLRDGERDSMASPRTPCKRRLNDAGR